MAGRVEVCCCGNELTRRPGEPLVRVNRSPCRCAEPGAGSRHAGATGIPTTITEGQVRERRAKGLPVMTDWEKAQHGRWV